MHALRHGSSLTNLSALRPKEVPAGQGAKWMRLDQQQALRLVARLSNPSVMQDTRWKSAGRDGNIPAVT